ncbi:MAG TPA: hypothetical protein VGR35_06815 [Tepidisphaeraceae bacterium]|nr:hypothetical protein [Tepidisphaeraceae bacterium]
MATDRIISDRPVNNGGGVISTASGPQPIGVVHEEHLSDKLEITDSIGLQINDEPPVIARPGDDLNAPAYRLGNLLSLPNAGKWRGHAFSGMVMALRMYNERSCRTM